MNKQALNLAVIYFVVFFGIGSFLPYNSVYLQDVLGYDGNEMGLFYGLSALIVTLSVPFFGIIADKIRSPKKVLIFCSIATFIFFIPYNFVQPFFLLTTLYIFINGIRSAIFPMIDAMSIDYSIRYNINYGIFRSVSSLAFIIASLIMGFLLDKFPHLTNIFIYSQMVMLLLSAYFGAKQKNTYSANVEINDYFKEDILALVKNKQYLLVIFIMGIGYATIQAAQSYLSLSILELGGNAEIVGFAFLFLVIPEVIFCSFVLRICLKIPHIHLMLFATIFLLFRWIVLYFTNSIPLLLIVSSSHGFIMAFVVLVGTDLVRRIVKPHLLSTAMSIYTGLASCFIAIFSFLAGVLMNDASIKNTYLLYIFTTIVAIVAIIIYIFNFSGRLKNE